PPITGTTASIPFMITAAMKVQLSALGYSDDDIRNMTPKQAHEILGPLPAPTPQPPPSPAPPPRVKIANAADLETFDPWDHFIVPAFPFEILPDIIQDYVGAQSTVIGCDPSAFAMAVLATFSGALHHGFALKMMRNGAWYERPRLWVLLVGNPSTRKTPI